MYKIQANQRMNQNSYTDKNNFYINRKSKTYRT